MSTRRGRRAPDLGVSKGPCASGRPRVAFVPPSTPPERFSSPVTDDLLDRFRAHLGSARLFAPPGGVVLAVSGGGDSLALLELMARTAPAFGLELSVAHVDHGIVPGSDLAARQVQQAAARWELPFTGVALGLGAGTSETAAREARYRALREIQHSTGAAYLATAHHADDQIETVLFRVLRGSAPAGLAGIAPRQPDGLVRPLLPFRRAEIRAWMAEEVPGSPFEDPANLEIRHERAWIRHELLDTLRARFGDVEDRLLDLSRYAALDREAWSSLLRVLPGLDPTVSDGAIEVARHPLEPYDSPLRQAILRAAALDVGCVLGPGRAERLARFIMSAASGRRFEIGSGWACVIAFDRIRIFSQDRVAPVPEAAAWGDCDAGEVRWGRWSIRWQAGEAAPATRRGWTTWVTPGRGLIRSVRPGDRLYPVGGRGRRPVTRLLMEGRVPRWDRAAYPLVVRDDEILWLPGICRSNVGVPASGRKAVRLDASVERDS